MKSIRDLSGQMEEIRKTFWLEKLSLPLEWQQLAGDELSDPEKILVELPCDALLLSQEASDTLFAKAQRIPAEVVEVQFADCLLREQKKVWLRCFLKEALKRLILKKAPGLDTHSTCYVTGSGAWSRMCAAVAIQMGFRRIVMITSQSEEALANVQKFSRLYFDLKFQILGETELTSQPSNGSLLLNTLTPEEGGTIFDDLTYLNFLKKEGLVVDLPLSLQSNPLLEEADHVGVRYLAGQEIWGMRDWLFLSSLLAGEMPSPWSGHESNYLEEWKKFLSTLKQT